eukprot:TRINITY_DN53643_c0_g1_i1.p1 TRINITY_DN53643_c0_g1~~TRINITY_DN53643_c0_g1_i1.p1  ORF type:complete len:596 (-),score=133.12 TRINITY_DN53643_c0_g1_i1:93-1880(-)
MAPVGERPSVDGALEKAGYTRLRTVGEGAFGVAVLVNHPDREGTPIIKMVNTNQATRKEREAALKESQVLSSLRHPCIVKYMDTFLSDGFLCIVMDFCEGGDLSYRIKQARDDERPFRKEMVIGWFSQATLALEYIHKRHILHRDLKSGNLFLSKRDNLKLGDFGIAKVLDSTLALAQTRIGTPYYMSPELCEGTSYAWSADIWSLGVILYEMCALKYPFEAYNLPNLVRKITTAPIPDLPTEYPDGLQKLFHGMMEREAEKRPTAEEIKSHPLVQDMLRRMTKETQPEGDAAVEKRKSVSPTQSEQYAAFAGQYEEDQSVEYYSETHREWLAARVIKVDTEGRITLNLKPNTWISLDLQVARVRPPTGGSPTAAKQAKAGGGEAPAEDAAVPPATAARGAGQRPSLLRVEKKDSSRPSSARGTPRSISKQLPAGVQGEPPPLRRLSRQPSEDALRLQKRPSRQPSKDGPLLSRQPSQDKNPFRQPLSARDRPPSLGRLARDASDKSLQDGSRQATPTGGSRQPTPTRASFGPRRASQDRLPTPPGGKASPRVSPRGLRPAAPKGSAAASVPASSQCSQVSGPSKGGYPRCVPAS